MGKDLKKGLIGLGAGTLLYNKVFNVNNSTSSRTAAGDSENTAVTTAGDGDNTSSTTTSTTTGTGANPDDYRIDNHSATAANPAKLETDYDGTNTPKVVFINEGYILMSLPWFTGIGSSPGTLEQAYRKKAYAFFLNNGNVRLSLGSPADLKIRKQVLSENLIEWANYMAILVELYPNSHLVTPDYPGLALDTDKEDAILKKLWPEW